MRHEKWILTFALLQFFVVYGHGARDATLRAETHGSGASATRPQSIGYSFESRSPLPPLDSKTQKQIELLILQLGDGDFSVREAASAALRRFGPAAYPFLAKAVASTDAEIRLRARALGTPLKATEGDFKLAFLKAAGESERVREMQEIFNRIEKALLPEERARLRELSEKDKEFELAQVKNYSEKDAEARKQREAFISKGAALVEETRSIYSTVLKRMGMPPLENGGSLQWPGLKHPAELYLFRTNLYINAIKPKDNDDNSGSASVSTDGVLPKEQKIHGMPCRVVGPFPQSGRSVYFWPRLRRLGREPGVFELDSINQKYEFGEGKYSTVLGRTDVVDWGEVEKVVEAPQGTLSSAKPNQDELQTVLRIRAWHP